MNDWNENELNYLRNLSQNCERLAQRFNTIQAKIKSHQHKLKLPSIILSSIAGLFSFGSSSFTNPQAISIAVGSVNIAISIIASIDSLLGFSQIIEKSAKASVDFVKLKEKIDLELSIPLNKRTTSSDLFMRESYNEYLSIFESTPQVLKNLRWINPSMRMEIESVSESPSCLGNYKIERQAPTILITSKD